MICGFRAYLANMDLLGGILLDVFLFLRVEFMRPYYYTFLKRCSVCDTTKDSILTPVYYNLKHINGP